MWKAKAFSLNSVEYKLDKMKDLLMEARSGNLDGFTELAILTSAAQKAEDKLYQVLKANEELEGRIKEAMKVAKDWDLDDSDLNSALKRVNNNMQTVRKFIKVAQAAK